MSPNTQLHKYTVKVLQSQKTERSIFVMATSEKDASKRALGLCEQEKQLNTTFVVNEVVYEG